MSLRLLFFPRHCILVSLQRWARITSIVDHPEVFHFALIGAGKDKLLAI